MALLISGYCLPVFQFSPLHERQLLLESILDYLKSYFNSRLCMRGRVSCRKIACVAALFQFSPLHERQLQAILPPCSDRLFQFTPLHERQPQATTEHQVPQAFQFTPLHERQHQCPGASGSG